MRHHIHEDCSDCFERWTEWSNQIINRPITGFDAKSNLDGSHFSFSQQQKATHIQINWIIEDLCRRRKNSEHIKAILTAFI